jgi:UDP-glucuronate decarboxylase
MTARMEDDSIMGTSIQESVEAVVRTMPDLQRLRGKHLLLTGGTGFIGTWLLETIAYLNDRWADPCCVYVPTRDVQAFARKKPHLAGRAEFAFSPGDVSSFAYPDAQCDFIIHAAAPASPKVAATKPIAVGETIVAGTRHVLHIASQHAIEGFLFISSGAVYGAQPPDLERIPEDYRGGPDISAARSAYGEGKRYAEFLCVAHQQDLNLPVTIARPFTFVGPYQDLDSGFAVTDFMRDGLRGKPLTIEGDGTTVRSYCGPSDMLQALWGVLFRGTPGRAYNVGSDEPISIFDLARHVVKALDRPTEIRVACQPVPGRLPDRYVPDITRLKTELRILPQAELDTALKQTVEWAARAGAAPD